LKNLPQSKVFSVALSVGWAINLPGPFFSLLIYLQRSKKRFDPVIQQNDVLNYEEEDTDSNPE
jgi:hypothetical protein